MFNQTKDLLNQLILTNHRLSSNTHDTALINIKFLLLETLITSINHAINSEAIFQLRGLEKNLFLKLITEVYICETQNSDFDFYQGNIDTSMKYFLATLVERLYLLELENQAYTPKIA